MIDDSAIKKAANRKKIKSLRFISDRKKRIISGESADCLRLLFRISLWFTPSSFRSILSMIYTERKSCKTLSFDYCYFSFTVT